MSANPDVLQEPEAAESTVEETPLPLTGVFGQTLDWNPEDFALEQIRNLVRRVFLTGAAPQATQIAISAAEKETDAFELCDQVGWALALETGSDVAVVGGGELPLGDRLRPHSRFAGRVTIKSWSTQKATNLWHVPQRGGRDRGTGRYWLSFLAELRNEFQYSIILAPNAGKSTEAALLGQLADGVILVLEAHRTRKATARKIKETMLASQCRILGTVLSERTFPLPEWIYRRL